MAKKTILSGMRPTGRLHIGHWMGALSNWVSLQDEYDCYFMVADWHALMGEYKNPRGIRPAMYDNVADWLAWGIDPECATVFVQSDVREHLELYAVLSSMTPIGWLERCPTYKDQVQQLQEKEINTHAFLGYPTLQTADIALYGAHAVPVGEDQVPHLELAREVIRRFNGIAGADILVEPKPLLTPVSRLLGLDGRKMSKSFDNCIYLDDDTETLHKKIFNMLTDTARMRKSDPGNPDVCNLFSNYKCFMPESEYATICEGCRTASRGCVECKKLLKESIDKMLAPKRERKKELLADPKNIDAVLDAGREKAQAKAKETMKAVKDALGCFRA
jgi:tryptophanyl-tRNA synthetase